MSKRGMIDELFEQCDECFWLILLAEVARVLQLYDRGTRKVCLKNGNKVLWQQCPVLHTLD